MNSPSLYRSGAAHTGIAATLGTHRVLRNTYALLSLTLLFSAAVASLSAALRLPHPGLLLTLAGYFGLLFFIHKKQNSGWAVGGVFALTGFMGYTLGPVLAAHRPLPWRWAPPVPPSWRCRAVCWPRAVTSASWAASCSLAW